MRMNSRDEKAGVAAGQFAAVVLLLVAVWLVYLRVTFHSLTRFMAVIDTCPLTFCDFANHYLPMGRHVFDRTGPVPGFLYTPFFALLVALVAQLSDTGAVIAWGVAQVGLTILLLVVPRRLVRRPGLAAAALYVFLFLSAFPVLHNFKWGQISVLVTLCVLGSLALWQRGHAVVAGFLLAFATSIKFYPAWFALALLLRRDWRALSAYAVFCALFLVAVPAVALGPHATLQFYLDVLAQLRVRADGMLNDVNSQSLEGLLTRLCYSAGSPWPTSLSLFEPVRWGVLAVALPSVWLSLRRAKGGEMRAFLILFCALPFVTPTS